MLTNVNNSMVGEALSNCMVINGNIQFLKNYNTAELKMIYDKFTEDLLNYNIPHWKVIGFYHGWDSPVKKSVFTRNDIYNKSLLEIGFAMGDIIVERNGGIDLEAGCFYGIDEEVENLEEFDRNFGKPVAGSKRTKRTGALNVPRSEVGSIMCDTEMPPERTRVDYVGTDTIMYTQFNLIDEPDVPQFLVPHVKVCDISDSDFGCPRMFMFIKRGTGILDYSETQKFFLDDYVNIMPCRTVYDLTKYICCMAPMAGGNSLRLVYRVPINENVLQTILREYGKELENQ